MNVKTNVMVRDQSLRIVIAKLYSIGFWDTAKLSGGYGSTLKLLAGGRNEHLTNGHGFTEGDISLVASDRISMESQILH